MTDRTDRRAGWFRIGVLLQVVAIHAALLLVGSRWAIRLGQRREASLVFLSLPDTARPPAASTSAPAPRQRKPAASPDTQLLSIPPPTQPEASAKAAAPIDWNAEAELAVRKLAQAAAGPLPRALDRPGRGGDFNGGLGPDKRRKPEFAWDRKHTQRVQVAGGAVVVRVSDHCIVAFIPFPFAMCGIGKIPVRGDLLDHMNDDPPEAISEKNAAP